MQMTQKDTNAAIMQNDSNDTNAEMMQMTQKTQMPQ
jgi:hypothetical protein